MNPVRKTQWLGRPFPRIEAGLKVAGGIRYLDDMDFGPDLVYAAIVHSTRPHARLVGVDTAPAQALEGVFAVLTGRDVPGRLGHALADRPILAHDRVRYVGEPVAVVAAVSPELAVAAAQRVKVTYEDLPGVFDSEKALRPDAPLLHPQVDEYERRAFVHPRAGTNLAHVCRARRGDMEAGWQAASTVLADTYRVAPIQHASMEPHGAVAQCHPDGTITLWASTQAPFVQQATIAQTLGLDPRRLHVRAAAVGGGFGGKSFVSIEALVVLLALALPGRPVKLVLQRAEEFTTTFVRPALLAHVRMGADRHGKLTALEAHYVWDAGASADALIELAWAAALAGTGPYAIPHVDLTSSVVYTNHTPAAPMRGNGMAEVHWAIEQHMDRMAAALGIDPMSFRLRNLIKGGDPVWDGQVMHATGLEQCLRQVAQAVRWQAAPGKPSSAGRRRGRGLAVMWSPVLRHMAISATAVVRLESSPAAEAIQPVVVEVGSPDTGQGFATLVVQLVSSLLGVPPEWVQLQPIDTARSSFQGPGLSGQLTWSQGNAIVRAVQDLRGRLLSAVAQAWDEPPGALDIVEGVIHSHASHRSLSLRQLVQEGVRLADGSVLRPELRGEGRFEPTAPDEAGDEQALGVVHFSTGAQAVEVEVDLETGTIDVLHIASAFDVGHALNPDLVVAQIKGGAMQALSATLFEQVRRADGIPLNVRLSDYHLATILDLPPTIEAVVVEVPQGDGPFGARGVSDHAGVGLAPAIANAVAQATGVRITAMPITPEHVWRALQT
ncbi:MAG: xanthine dehydrogenase family protein molybdopterin-binding subunit [Anaerolineae bacterium]|nr:xanthine dehydrogenase family protein molybdopterin-binding subunit [Anaerolineae bacterium]